MAIYDYKIAPLDQGVAGLANVATPGTSVKQPVEPRGLDAYEPLCIIPQAQPTGPLAHLGTDQSAPAYIRTTNAARTCATYKVMMHHQKPDEMASAFKSRDTTRHVVTIRFTMLELQA